MNNRNTDGILAHSARKAEETRIRANEAIERLKASGERITFAAVARESGLSRSSLYSNEFVKVRIKSLAALEASPRRPKKKEAKDELSRMALLAERVRELESQKTLLIAQLAEMELLRMENEELRRIVRSRERNQDFKVVKRS